MGTVRRLYLYAASLVSLIVLAAGAQLFLASVLDTILAPLGASVLGVDRPGAPISLAIALVVVAAPIWAIHWWLLERGLIGDSAPAEENRRSALRGLFFALVLVGALAFFAGAAFELLRAVLVNAAAPRLDLELALPDRLATLVVTAAAWLYHFRLRNNELRRTRLDDAAAWLPRLYRYGATTIGVLMLAGGSARAVTSFLDGMLERTLTDPSWWIHETISGAVLALVGLAIWLTHWRDADNATRDAAVIGEDERLTRLRAVYFGTVIVVAVAVSAHAIYSVVGALGTLLVGAQAPTTPVDIVRSLLGPLVFAAPFAIVGWLHFRHQRSELILTTGAESPAHRSTRSATAYLVAAVGLVFLGVGAFSILDELLHAIAGDRVLIASADPGLRIIDAGAALIVAALTWLPAWAWLLRRRAIDTAFELRSVVSRVYLYVVIGLSLIVFVPAAALIIYRLLDGISGGGTADLVGNLATPAASLLVSGAIAGYHGLLLRGERAALAATEPPAKVEGPAEPTATAPIAVGLVLHVPESTDLEAVIERIRRSLPAGVTLEAGTPGGL